MGDDQVFWEKRLGFMRAASEVRHVASSSMGVIRRYLLCDSFQLHYECCDFSNQFSARVRFGHLIDEPSEPLSQFDILCTLHNIFAITCEPFTSQQKHPHPKKETFFSNQINGSG